jgi:hypothetical protein
MQVVRGVDNVTSGRFTVPEVDTRPSIVGRFLSGTGGENYTSDAPTPEATDFWNSTEEFDVEAFLQTHLGRRHRNVGESVILILVYSVIFFTGVVGNVCTCLVIIKNKRMHTATNYYLFSLAVSDLLTLILGQFAFLFFTSRVYER